VQAGPVQPKGWDNVAPVSNLSVSAPTVRRALTFFKIMAFVVGVGLLLLVLGMVLRYGFDRPRVSEVWSPIHGFLYMVYVVATANLGFKVKWGLGKMVLVMLAGTAPFLSFWAERKVSDEVETRLAKAAA
jgi:integral membrane protein